MAAMTVTMIGSTARVKKTLSSLMLAAISVTRLFPFPFVSPVGVRWCRVVKVPVWNSVSRWNVMPRPTNRLVQCTLLWTNVYMVTVVSVVGMSRP